MPRDRFIRNKQRDIGIRSSVNDSYDSFHGAFVGGSHQNKIHRERLQAAINAGVKGSVRRVFEEFLRWLSEEPTRTLTKGRLAWLCVEEQHVAYRAKGIAPQLTEAQLNEVTTKRHYVCKKPAHEAFFESPKPLAPPQPRKV